MDHIFDSMNYVGDEDYEDVDEEGYLLPQHQNESKSPYETQKPISIHKACFIIFNGVYGAGILALPFIVHMGGIVTFGILLYIFLAEVYTALSFRDCIDHLKEDGKKNYPYTYQSIAGVIWGRSGNVIVSFIWTIGLLFVLINYLILSADIFKALSGYTFTHSISLASLLVLLLILAFPNLSQIAWLSVWGVISAVICTGIVVLDSKEIVFDASSQHPTHQFHRSFCPELPLQKLVLILTMLSQPMGFHSMIPAIYGALKKKKKEDWNWIVMIVYGAIACFKTLFMIMSYTANHKLGLVQIVMRSRILQIAATVGIISDQIVPFPLVVKSFSFEANIYYSSRYLKKPNTALTDWKGHLFHIIFTVFILFLAMIIAFILPFQPFYAAFVGGLSVIFAQVLPCVFQLYLFRKKNTLFKKACSVFIILIGSAIAVISIYTSFTLVFQGKLYFHKCALPYQLQEVNYLLDSLTNQSSVKTITNF